MKDVSSKYNFNFLKHNYFFKLYELYHLGSRVETTLPYNLFAKKISETDGRAVTPIYKFVLYILTSKTK